MKEKEVDKKIIKEVIYLEKNKKFIITDNPETASLLIHAGFHQVGESTRIWTFVNEPSKLLFSNLDDIVYTDKMFI